MSKARENILQRLRGETPPNLPLSGEEQDASTATVQKPSSSDKGRPEGVSSHDWDTTERIRRFTDRMSAVRAEVHHSDKDNWLALLAELCQSKGLNNLLLSPHTSWGQAIHAQAERFPQLRAYAQPIEDWKEEMFYGIDAGLTSTLGGIAETGSLILWPDTEEPRQLSLVPPVHFAILEAEQIYTTFAEAMQEQRWAERGMPTNALLISGPSKSADIAQVMAYGVHGPKELVVIVV